MSPAAVVLRPGFSSSIVAISAVFSFGSVRSLETFCGRVGLFFRAALNVTADIVAHLEGGWRSKRLISYFRILNLQLNKINTK